MASCSPIWVKITDFEISKYYGGSALRTNCGTVVYQAPELLGLLRRGMAVTAKSYTKNVDIWALGVVVHEVLTSEIPFLEKDPTVDSMLVSCDSALDTRSVDMDLLFHYCRGQSFPITTLQKNLVSPDGIDFLKSLMVANPMHRVSAAEALKAGWFARITDLEDATTAPFPQRNVVDEGGSRREIMASTVLPSSPRNQVGLFHQSSILAEGGSR